MSATAERVVRSVRFGAGSRVITPEPGCEMSGFIARQSPMSGVHDDLTVRVAVWSESESIERAASLVTFDLLDFEWDQVAQLRASIEAATGISRDRIGITCTHTHGGPATLTGGQLGKVREGYLDRVYDLAAEAAHDAVQSREPVLLTTGIGRETTVGKNRRIDGGLIDPDVPVIRHQRRDGSIAGLFTSYACHPVTLGPNNLLATADYPGYVRRTLEAVYPGAAIQFATGCCGQINNGHTSRDGEKGRGLHWRTFGEAERIARAIAGTAIQAAEQPARLETAASLLEVEAHPAAIRTARREVDLPYLPLPDASEIEQLRARWTEDERAIRERGPRTGELESLAVSRRWADMVESGDVASSAPAEVFVIGLDEIALVLLPGESFVEFGLEVKERFAPRPIITLAYSNGCPGYIPHRSTYPAGGYEVAEAYRYYGAPACFAPEAGELLVATAIELVESLDD